MRICTEPRSWVGILGSVPLPSLEQSLLWNFEFMTFFTTVIFNYSCMRNYVVNTWEVGVI